MRLRLPKDAKAPLLARAFVRTAMCEKHSREARDEVELLVSELVTNAVVHGGSLVTMEVDCEGPQGIAVTVRDSSPSWPVSRSAGPLDEGGRGMALVELISDAWGVHEAGLPQAPDDGQAASAGPVDQVLARVPRQAQGKAVWFRLAG
ncbi:ATP-binding protein [Quadrisphaera sp. DSM 44207]|uniref:ATP-binding protein n=1 Tax=Quadrisphaera sp. DSM 44207 TaxID=1881057 RepID=UPI00088030CB|nr:ATP-binding protein [Quadrisphaera sp. DSM 44207]SDQ51651.1 Anti-sigma regulatory factor (Ser/Thr protein kinase) [Quadrisphaera sp. DSM 44207]